LLPTSFFLWLSASSPSNVFCCCAVSGRLSNGFVDYYIFFVL
jgi:hypothetical protein